MRMEQIECSETSVYKIQTPGNHPEENIQQILDFFTLEDGPIDFPEKSVRNYRYTLLNMTKNFRSHMTLLFVW
jgi:hypothetical protein